MPVLSPEFICFFCYRKGYDEFHPEFNNSNTIIPPKNSINFLREHVIKSHGFPNNFTNQQSSYLLTLMACYFTSSVDFPDFSYTFFGKCPPIISKKLLLRVDCNWAIRHF